MARLAAPARRLLHGRGQQAAEAPARSGPRTTARATRARPWPWSTRSPRNTRHGADPERGQPQRAAVPGRAGGRRGARASSARPEPSGRGRRPPAHARALMGAIKDVERTTIEAALTGSRQLAVKALALHPLVQSTRTARGSSTPTVRAQPALRGGSVGVDVACVGPVFLDLTFIGLDGDPAARAGALRERAATSPPAAWPTSPSGGPARAVDRAGTAIGHDVAGEYLRRGSAARHRVPAPSRRAPRSPRSCPPPGTGRWRRSTRTSPVPRRRRDARPRGPSWPTWPAPSSRGPTARRCTRSSATPTPALRGLPPGSERGRRALRERRRGQRLAGADDPARPPRRLADALSQRRGDARPARGDRRRGRRRPRPRARPRRWPWSDTTGAGDLFAAA